MNSLFSGAGKLQLDTSSLLDDDGSNQSEIDKLEIGEASPKRFPDRPKIRYTPTENDFENLPGFDLSTGNEWHYPTGVELRTYQFTITERCLYQNCLVCIPTGLGKTLIAAVVLHNFLRWYPNSRVVFMAPTRPLVSQQMFACRDLTGLSISGKHAAEAVELTGTTPPPQRAAMWNGQHRAFFLTPQVIANDLASGICPATSISCIVIDEAHKATGNHAYCQVIRGITGEPYNHRQFRIVALSATPSTHLNGAQSIIANLLISHLEVRNESSLDVRPYCHRRAIETIVVRLDPQLSAFKERLCALAIPPLQRLCERNALWTPNRGKHPDPESFAPFTLVKARENFIKQNQFSPYTGMIMRDFRIAACFARSLQLLTQYGLRPVYQFLLSNTESSDELAQVSGLQEFINDIGSALGISNSDETMSQIPFVFGHPKLFKLRDVLMDHFSKSINNCLSQRGTRAIVFTQYRDSVADIMHMLKSYSTLLRPAVFVGQSSCDQGHVRKKNTQRDQLEVMEAFREGRVNILISTSIGEEGLDIGQVDLIVCYDAHKSPSRLIQRLGRTGRKRSGRVVVLLTEGREQSNFSLSVARSSTVHTTLLQGQANRQLAFYPHNPRMVPLGIDPVPVFWQPVRSDSDVPIKRKSLGDIKKKYSLPHYNFRLSPCRQSALISLGQAAEVCVDTFSNRYSLNRRIGAAREGFQSEVTGSSKTTWNLVASLRLIELHRRGRTHAMYHATGMRKVDMTTPLSELIPTSMSQLTQTVSGSIVNQPLDLQSSTNSKPSMRLFRGLVSRKLLVDPHFVIGEELNLLSTVSISGITLDDLNQAFETILSNCDVIDTPARKDASAMLTPTNLIFDNGFGLPAPIPRKSLNLHRNCELPPAKRRRFTIGLGSEVEKPPISDLNFNKNLRFGKDFDDLFDAACTRVVFSNVLEGVNKSYTCNFALNFLSYECPNRLKVTFCAFSQCGNYFGFVENRNHVYIYETSQLVDPLSRKIDAESAWYMSNNGTRIPVNIGPIISLDVSNSNAGVEVNYIAFGNGQISRCRLPHRLSKRRSIVTTKYPDRVCVLAVAKSNGYIDVFSINLLKENSSPLLAKMVLFDGRQSIVHLCMSSEGALRLASTSFRGDVKLWDIWDDGNMYATLTLNTGCPSFGNVIDVKASKRLASVPYNQAIAVTAWHPFGGHIFLGDQQGHGLVLQDEKPYGCLNVLRHYHIISGAVYSHDGDFLVTSSFDGSCALWSVPSYTQVFSVWHMTVKRNIRLLGGVNDFHVTALALSPDSESFATFCEDGTLRLWPLSHTLEYRILIHLSDLDRQSVHERALAWGSCGLLLAFSLGDHRLQIWNPTQLATGSLVNLCVSAIRRHVVSGLCANNPVSCCRQRALNEGSLLTALSALPIPRLLRSLLCRDLKADISVTTAATPTVSSKL
nr:fanconi anemia group M protein [Hymenolepis microstoma]